MKKHGTQEKFKSARLWKRLLSFIIDLFLINLTLFSPFRSVISGIIPTTGFEETMGYIQANPEVFNNILWVIMVMSGLAILYFSIMERIFAQTIGKMLMHIRVISLNERLRFWQCLIRSLFLIPSFPFNLFWIIEPISLLISKEKRRTLELLSRTRTIEEQTRV